MPGHMMSHSQPWHVTWQLLILRNRSHDIIHIPQYHMAGPWYYHSPAEPLPWRSHIGNRHQGQRLPLSQSYLCPHWRLAHSSGVLCLSWLHHPRHRSQPLRCCTYVCSIYMLQVWMSVHACECECDVCHVSVWCACVSSACVWMYGWSVGWWY